MRTSPRLAARDARLVGVNLARAFTLYFAAQLAPRMLKTSRPMGWSAKVTSQEWRIGWFSEADPTVDSASIQSVVGQPFGQLS